MILALLLAIEVAIPAIPEFPRYVNNHKYLYGKMNAAVLLRPKGTPWTAMSFSPAKTPLLYVETYFFCGNEMEKLNAFEGKDVAIVFGRAAERKLAFSDPPEVIVCYRLDGVKEVSDGEGK